MEHGKSLRPSILISTYLFVTLLFDAAMLRTLWLSVHSQSIRSIFAASFSIKLVLCILEGIEKRKFFKEEYTNSSPEESSGFYGHGLLWWLNRIIRLGAKQVLTPLDLYSLSKDMSSETSLNEFWKAWINR
jgi:hypothetical protein